MSKTAKSYAGIADRPVAVRRPATWRVDALAASIFLALGLGLVLLPYTTGRKMPGDLGDSRFNLALLEFFYRTLPALLHARPADFLNAPFFYPWPGVTNFSDTFWGNGEVYALARALGAAELAAFRAWFLAGFALTYIVAFLSFRKLGLRTFGAATGAFLFTFPLPMAAQFDHVQLVYRLWIPPAVLAFDGFLTRRSLRGGAAAVLFVALQLAVSIYLGLFLCLLLASYAAALCLVARNRLALPRWAAARSAAATTLVTTGILFAAGLVVLAVVGIPYFDVQSMYGFTRSWHEVAAGLPRPASYLLSGASTLWPNLSSRFPLPLLVEQQIFPGAAAIVPFAWFLLSSRARARHSLIAPMLACAAILFVLTIDLGGHTLYRLIYPLPGFSAVRAVARVVLVTMLPLAVLFGLLVDDLTALGSSRLQRGFLAALLSGFMVAECSLVGHYGSAPTAWSARLEALESRLPKHLPPRAVLAVATPPLGPGTDWAWILPQIDAEVAAATFGISTMNGYSGNRPPTWKTITTCEDIADNIRAGRHFREVHDLPRPRITSERLVLIGFGSCDPVPLARDPILELGRTYRFSEGAVGNEFLADGFSYPESWGRWTDRKNAFLFFRLPAAPRGAVSLDVGATALSPAADRRQVVAVLANGRSCGSLVITANQSHGRATCPVGALRAGDNMLHLRIGHPTRPIDLGTGKDRRELGLGLETLAITPER